jgi:hypothetical protein
MSAHDPPGMEDVLEVVDGIFIRASAIRRIKLLFTLLVMSVGMLGMDQAYDRFQLVPLESPVAAPLEPPRTRQNNAKILTELNYLNRFKDTRSRVLDVVRFCTVMVPQGVKILSWGLTRSRPLEGTERLRVKITGNATDEATFRAYREGLQAAAPWARIAEAPRPDAPPDSTGVMFRLETESD